MYSLLIFSSLTNRLTNRHEYVPWVCEAAQFWYVRILCRVRKQVLPKLWHTFAEIHGITIQDDREIPVSNNHISKQLMTSAKLKKKLPYFGLYSGMLSFLVTCKSSWKFQKQFRRRRHGNTWSGLWRLLWKQRCNLFRLSWPRTWYRNSHQAQTTSKLLVQILRILHETLKKCLSSYFCACLECH
jgi:hypothetical protein